MKAPLCSRPWKLTWWRQRRRGAVSAIGPR
jgi:hypothetical protein